MNLLLSPNCRIFLASNRVYLNELLYLIASGKHFLVSPSPDMLRELLTHETWDVYGEYLNRASKAAVNLSRATWTKPENCSDCDAEPLVRYLAEPLALFVENATTDGGFLRLASAAFGLTRLADEWDRGRHLRVIQCGGNGEIPKLVALHASTAPAPPDGLPARVIVIADSDCTPEDPKMSATSVVIVTTCAAKGFYCHVWRKRAIENYVSDSDLRTFASHAKARKRFRDNHLDVISLPRIDRDRIKIKDRLGDFLADLIEANGRFDRAGLMERDDLQEVLEVLSTMEQRL